MPRADTEIDLKNLVITRNCKNCLRLPVCWLVVSLKNALDGHQKVAGIMMFEWSKLGEVCEQYASVPIMTVESESL